MNDLKPCPFCGNIPDEDSHYTNQGTKWGGILCCIEGPEVCTSYKEWPAWKDDAIEAWNIRYEAAKEAGQPVFNKEAMMGTCCENGYFGTPHDCMKKNPNDQAAGNVGTMNNKIKNQERRLTQPEPPNDENTTIIHSHIPDEAIFLCPGSKYVVIRPRSEASKKDGQPDDCPDCGASMIEVCSGLEKGARGEYAAGCTATKWECFCDEAYYHQWAVREVGEKRWGHCFHVPSKEEAEGLRDILNSRPMREIVAPRISHSLTYLHNMLDRRLSHESEAEAAWCDDLLEHVKTLQEILHVD